MAHRSLYVMCLILTGVRTAPDPDPAQAPKVYNALITSNQNLEPSKAYPVYQPVLQDPFLFPYQPAIYYNGDYPFGNGLLPAPPIPKTSPQQPPSSSTPEPKPSTKIPKLPPADTTGSSSKDKPTPAPPLPPKTESPIPVNQFGLPPQVFPLGQIDPAYNGFTHIPQFPYTFPSFRFYDPYNPFSFNPYLNLSPVYRPLPNILDQNKLLPAKTSSAPTAVQVPPSEPNDLNLLNYASKDPAIPNVPPPPLPLGGLKKNVE